MKTLESFSSRTSQDEHDERTYHFLEDPDMVATGVHSYSILITAGF
jgi:hypothetical protein